MSNRLNYLFKVTFLSIGLIFYEISGLTLVDDGNRKWFKGQLHCHTLNSDGNKSTTEVITKYQVAGYDFVAISDHNLITSTWQFTTPNFLTFPNTELTYSSNHVNAINLKGPFPTGTHNTLQEVINLALKANAVPQINHPHWSSHTSTTILNTHGALLLEVISRFSNFQYDADIWDTYLSKGRQIFGSGMDDAHTYANDFNVGWIMVCAPALDTGKIVGAIRKGHFYASNGPIINKIEMANRTMTVESEDGVGILFIGKNGITLHGVRTQSGSYTLPQEGLYVRAKVVNATGKIAYTQAYFPDSMDVNLKTSPRFGNQNNGILEVSPNPFNPSTVIKVWCSGFRGPSVVLKVYNINGKQIANLTRNPKLETPNSLTWNAVNHPSGIYILKAQIGNHRISKRLILQK